MVGFSSRGSQEERVVILRLALAHKGASMNSGHYDLMPSQSSVVVEQSATGDEGGVHL